MRYQWLPTVHPRRVLGINEAGIELQARARQNFIGVRCSAWIGFDQTEDVGVIQIGSTDVATWLTTVGVIDRVNGGKGIAGGWRKRRNGLGKSGEGDICGYN